MIQLDLLESLENLVHSQLLNFEHLNSILTENHVVRLIVPTFF